MKRVIVAGLVLLVSSVHAAPAAMDPDWPCRQIKIPELSVAEVWTGPPIDAAAESWKADATVRAMVERLAQRRIPIDQAEQELTSFAESAGALRQAKLLELFAGLFEELDGQRTEVVAGLDRFGVRQKELAAGLRTELGALHTEQDSPNPDATKLADTGQRVAWDARVFNERRETLTYACQVPDKIAQRLFQLARVIQQLMQ